MSSEPDYLLCLECETPSYTFEWKNGKLFEATCMTCGNVDIDTFASQEEFDAMGTAGH
jgi:hypothetical protein